MRYRCELILAMGMVFSGPVAAQSAPTCAPKVVAGRSSTDGGDGGQATAAQLYGPLGFAQDAAGNLYFADSLNNKIRVIRKDGTIQLVAGTGVAGSAGDGGAATNAQLNNPVAVAIAATGEIYIAEAGGNRIRKILASGTIQTVAGDGESRFGGDGGPAIQAHLNGPQGIALDSQGNLYISDTLNSRVRLVSKDGTIQTFAGGGTGTDSLADDGKPAVTAVVQVPGSLAVGADGTLYISDYGIISVTRDGILHDVTAGNAAPSDGTPAKQVAIQAPTYMALDSQGNILLVEEFAGNQVVWKIGADGNIHYVMDTYEGGGLLPMPDGTIVRGNQIAAQIVRYTPGTTKLGTIAPSVAIAGQPLRGNTGDGGPGTQAQINYPAGVATDLAGNLYIADTSAGRIRKLDTKGVISTVAGNSGISLTPDGTPALQSVVIPTGIAVNAAGEIYYAEAYNYRVRKIKADGTVVTVAGNRSYPSYVNPVDPWIGGPATAAAISPNSIALDGSGNLYIADDPSAAIWMVTPSGTLNLVTQLHSSPPPVLATDPGGTVYSLDQQGNLSRLGAGPQPQRVETLGNYTTFSRPFAIDSSGSLYLTGYDSILYQFSPAGTMRALTRSATPPLPVIAAAETFDRSGNLFIADAGLARVVELPSAATCAVPAFPFVSAVVNAASYTGEGSYTAGEIVQVYGTAVGPGTLVQAAFDANGSLPTTLSGTQVLVDGAPVPLLYTSAAVAAAIVPFGAGGQGSSTLQVSVNGLPSNSYWLPIGIASPGVFTNDASGSGQGAILNQDYSRNSAMNPAAKGSTVAVYATGLGLVSPAVADGTLTGGALSWQLQPVKALVDGQAATVTYAGTAPGLVAGLSQVNVTIPQSARSGAVPIVLYLDSYPSNYISQPKVTVAVQ